MIRWLASLIVTAALVASCSSTSSGTSGGSGAPPVTSCVAVACSGYAPSCGLLGICGGVDYIIDCEPTKGCTCSVKSDGGTTPGKSVAFSADFCPWGEAGAMCAPSAEQGLAAANVA